MILTSNKIRGQGKGSIKNRSLFKLNFNEGRTRTSNQAAKERIKTSRLITVSPKMKYNWFEQHFVAAKGDEKQTLRASETERHNPFSNQPNIRVIFQHKTNKAKKYKGEKLIKHDPSYNSRLQIAQERLLNCTIRGSRLGNREEEKKRQTERNKPSGRFPKKVCLQECIQEMKERSPSTEYLSIKEYFEAKYADKWENKRRFL